ncbi:MAG: phytanoyl-CoA dioxygenase family protein [Chloroflexota bacterium]|nr:phytanoyl-CoA dioxygenase family protein [Chloroflexota bacterium]
MLTRDQVATYQDKGYVTIPQLFPREELEELRRELDQLVQDWATTNAGWSGPWRDVYMSPDVEQRSMLTHLHDLHFYSAAWCRAVTKMAMAEAMADLLETPNVELHHTTLHLKPPETGMPFPLHQDSPFYRHEQPSYVDAIVHLDDTNDDNGCLRFVPGSHSRGHLEHIEEVDGKQVSPHLPTDEWPLDETEPAPAHAGDVVAFSIYTVHGSRINRTNRWRRLVRLGYRDPANRQLAGQSLGRAGLMVAGIRPIGALRAT